MQLETKGTKREEWPGYSNIAEELALSPNTVSTYRIRILKKLKLESNADLVRYAIKHGLVE